MAIQAMGRASIAAFILVVCCWLAGWLKIAVIPALRDLPQSSFSLFLLLENTEYSPSFSETRFRQVREGMNKRDVIELVGDPLQVIEDSRGRTVRAMELINGKWHVSYPDLPIGSRVSVEKITFSYSKPGISDHWYVRTVTFSPDGLVLRVHSTFYVD